MAISRLLAIVAAVLFVAVNATAATSAGGVVTVGQFATRLVAALGQDASDIGAVTAALRSMGVTADLDANAPLTAGMAARLAGDLGVKVAPPSTPASPVGAGQAAALASYIAGGFVDRAATALEDPPSQCLSSANRGACVNCCKDATGLTGQFCGHYCHANVPPPPSPGEPVP